MSKKVTFSSDIQCFLTLLEMPLKHFIECQRKAHISISRKNSQLKELFLKDGGEEDFMFEIEEAKSKIRTLLNHNFICVCLDVLIALDVNLKKVSVSFAGDELTLEVDAVKQWLFVLMMELDMILDS